MTNETQCCSCGQVQPYVASVSYSYTMVKTSISFSQVYDEMQAPTEVQGSHKDGRLFVHELPDIRQLLQPWYFPNAAHHNTEVARRTAAQAPDP